MAIRPKRKPKAQAALAALNMKKKNQSNMFNAMRQVGVQGQKVFGSKGKTK